MPAFLTCKEDNHLNSLAISSKFTYLCFHQLNLFVGEPLAGLPMGLIPCTGVFPEELDMPGMEMG